MNYDWIWIAMGFMPWCITLRRSPVDGRTLIVRSLFWSLAVVTQHDGSGSWTLRIPFISRLRDAAWVAILRLGGQLSGR
jgi:hypothetical protein